MYATLTGSIRSMLGFTLIEVMTVIMVAAILLVIGVPSLTDFLADQHVRATTSDIVAEFAFARAKAIETSRRVYIEKTGVNWKDGWRIFVDLNDNSAYDAGEEVKHFDGLSGNIRVCSNVADFETNIIFRPDGRIVRATIPSADDGVYVIDDMNNGDVIKNKIRGLLFGLSGRVTTVTLNGQLPPC